MPSAPPSRSALVLRLGALGDILLLRAAVALLKAAGYRVTLLAPAASGRALLGPGPSEAEALLDSDRADLARLWTADAEPPDEIARAARGLAYAVSRDADVASRLGRVAARLTPRSQPAGRRPRGGLAGGASSRSAGSGRATRTARVLARRAAGGAPAERLPNRFLALHPGSGSARKNWPGFADLARVLAPVDPFLAVCGAADADAARPLLALPNAVAAVGLAPRDLGALLSRAGAFVGNDSGVSHLAAAAGAPTLALFGPTDPAQWAPLGDRVATLRAEPIGALRVQDVAGAASTLWERRGPRSR
jgi:hypothetical protein